MCVCVGGRGILSAPGKGVGYNPSYPHETSFFAHKTLRYQTLLTPPPPLPSLRRRNSLSFVFQTAAVEICCRSTFLSIFFSWELFTFFGFEETLRKGGGKGCGKEGGLGSGLSGSSVCTLASEREEQVGGLSFQKKIKKKTPLSKLYA